MQRSILGLAAGCALATLSLLPAHASTPAEKVICTQAPRSQWLGEARMREIFGVKDFTLVKFKVTRGNCYEFYAVHHDGSLVEAYYDPVSGQPVRYNHIPPAAAATR